MTSVPLPAVRDAEPGNAPLTRAVVTPTPAAGGAGDVRVVPVPTLGLATRRRMCALLDEYYVNVSAGRFARDLDEKEWVVLGTEPGTQRVWGFSTIMRLRATVDGAPIVAFYSGDTVVRREHWGGRSERIIRATIRQMFGVAARETSPADRPAARCYWFMISSTPRSYRLLSLLLRAYVPAPRAPVTPWAARVMAELSRMKGFEYDAERSIVRFEHPTIFRPELCPPPGESAADPAVRYFARANPGAATGDRLASLVELTVENLTPLGRRLLER